jgi:hypothetical protein
VFASYVAEHGLSDRLRFVAGDFFSGDLPRADVVLMGHVLHDWSLRQEQALIRKAYEALPEGGALVVYEAIIDDERRQNAFGLLMSLNMLIETPAGFDYTGADCSSWMTSVGFRTTRVEHLVGPDSMVVGTKVHGRSMLVTSTGARLAAAAAVLLLAGSVAARAQGAVTMPRVGVLRPGNPPPGDFGQREAFEGGLRDLGWKPGTNILIEYRYAEGRPERLPELAAELVRLPVDVIVASAPVGVRAAQQATRTIVMSTLPDPVREGFVASLARPGGNTTGLTLDAQELAGKQLELLREAVPKLSRVAVLRNPSSTGWASPQRDKRIVQSGKILTAAGVSAGIDLALFVLGEVCGRERAEIAQLLIEYDPQPPFQSGHPCKASKPVLEAARAEMLARTRNPRDAISVPVILWRKTINRIRVRLGLARADPRQGAEPGGPASGGPAG